MKKITLLLLLLFVLVAQTFVYSQGYKGKGRVKGLVTDQVRNFIEFLKKK